MGRTGRTIQYLLLTGAISLLIPSALADPPTSCDTPAGGSEIRKYADLNQREINEICNLDFQYQLDSKLGRLLNRCKRTYSSIQKTAGDYLKEYRSQCNRIKVLTSKPISACDSEDTLKQADCLLEISRNYREASTAQKGLEEKLKTAQTEIEDAVKKNAEAINKYREAQAKLQTEVSQQEAIRNLAVQAGNPGVASEAEMKIKASREEQQTVPQLVSLQDSARTDGQKFAESSISAQKYHSQMATEYERQSIQAQSTARFLGAAETDSNIPRPKRRPDDLMTRYANNGGGSSGGGSGVGGNTTSASLSDPNATNGAYQPTTNPAPATNSGFPAGGTTAPAYSAPASTSYASAAGSDTPMDNSALETTNSSASNPLGSEAKSLSPAGYALSQGNQGSSGYEARESNEETESSQQSGPTEMAASAVAIGSRGAINEGSASGADPAAPGKIASTSASLSPGAGGYGRTSEAAANEVARKEEFSPNLNAGAVTIAGSDVKTAVDDLAKELGAGDLELDLDLDLGELTAEEKAALAPLEGSGAFNSNSNGQRKIASLGGNQHKAESLQESEAEPLFRRHRLALERAQKRGDLILNFRKKL